MEIATHPILRVLKVNRLKLTSTARGCVIVFDKPPNCQKAPIPEAIHRVGRCLNKIVPDFGWPGGEAVHSNGTAPRSAGNGRLHCLAKSLRVNLTLWGSRPGLRSFLKLRNGADVALLMPDGNTRVAPLIFVRVPGPWIQEPISQGQGF